MRFLKIIMTINCFNKISQKKVRATTKIIMFTKYENRATTKIIMFTKYENLKVIVNRLIEDTNKSVK